MKDLTTGSIARHILVMAAPVAISMVTQTAYQLIDLYFVARIGVAATAGVNAAGNIVVIFAALAQIVAAGTAPLVAQAVGRRSPESASLALNQSLVLATLLGAIAAGLSYFSIQPYLAVVSADAATLDAGIAFTQWMLPGLALTLPMAALGGALRGVGLIQPYVVISVVTVLVNAGLAPVLIAGYGTGKPLGVEGAGMATSLATLAGMVLFALYFRRYDYLVVARSLMRPQWHLWRRIGGLGLPASGEFAFLFFSTALVYYAVRDFGTASQAGFGIATRVLQVLLLPGMAIGFAIGPIAAQNFGARKHDRVLDTFWTAVVLGSSIMAATALFVQWQAARLVSVFGADAAAMEVAAQFLRLTSSTFVPQVLVYVCSNMFQALGNTVPALMSSAMRFATLLIAFGCLSMMQTFSIEQLWYALVLAALVQTVVSLWLLWIEWTRSLARAVNERA